MLTAEHGSGSDRSGAVAGAVRSRAGEVWTDAEYGFLVGRLIDAPTLARAGELARAWGVTPHEVMISLGWISAEDYARALRAFFALGMGRFGGVPAAVESGAATPAAIARALGAGQPVVLVPMSTQEILSAEAPRARRRRLEQAINGLRRERPELSAGRAMPIWQVIAVGALPMVFVGGFVVAPRIMTDLVLALMSLSFFLVVVLRTVAFAALAAGQATSSPAPRRRPSDAELPTFSVLVPLFQEAEVVAQVVSGLAALDYPVAKVEILLVLEASDRATRDALAGLDLPGHVRVVMVPNARPRTKPKALNYALGLARGDYITVFDAEDLPDRTQLRLAAARFLETNGNLGCLQGQLNVYNPDANWLTRQFTLEYSALFDGFLPALERLDLPIPLGGTSNHFPRRALDAVGGWDPFNVTEDADLGIKLARAGYRIEVLGSTTWEEAPVDFGTWLRQRTRWLKGWMITYLVHTRHPGRLLRDLGPWRFAGFHLLFGGFLASALAHPVLYMVLAFEVLSETPFASSGTLVGDALLAVAWFNITAGFGTAMVLAAIAVVQRKRARLLAHLLTMPAYWLLVSVAAYRALWHLATVPHLWEKTAHLGKVRAQTRAGRRRAQMRGGQARGGQTRGGQTRA